MKSHKKVVLNQSDEEQILEYLIANPTFFIRYPHVLDKIVLPHPVKGTISLLEAQQKRSYKNANRQYESYVGDYFLQ